MGGREGEEVLQRSEPPRLCPWPTSTATPLHNTAAERERERDTATVSRGGNKSRTDTLQDSSHLQQENNSVHTAVSHHNHNQK